MNITDWIYVSAPYRNNSKAGQERLTGRGNECDEKQRKVDRTLV
jgi:hypothetical protein